MQLAPQMHVRDAPASKAAAPPLPFPLPYPSPLALRIHPNQAAHKLSRGTLIATHIWRQFGLLTKQ